MSACIKDLLKEINKNNRPTVSWSVNTLDESFKDDMDAAISIERRLAAMKQVRGTANSGKRNKK